MNTLNAKYGHEGLVQVGDSNLCKMNTGRYGFRASNATVENMYH